MLYFDNNDAINTKDRKICRKKTKWIWMFKDMLATTTKNEEKIQIKDTH